MKVEEVLLQSLLSFVILFILSKILGKKQVAQLEFNDYVIGISIGSIAAQMATDPDIPSYHFIIAMALFALLDYLISIISRKGVFLKGIFKGNPLMLIEDGVINYKNLKKSKLDLNELMSQCRVQGYFDINEIAYCIFETCGDFSIMPKSYAREPVAQDLNLPKKQMGLSNDLIIDGQIIKEALQKIDKDSDWLLKNCQVTSKKELKNILLASYNETTQKMYIHYKNPNQLPPKALGKHFNQSQTKTKKTTK